MKSLTRRGVAAGLVGASLLAIATIPLAAQDSPRPARKKYDPARRVPPYFSKVGLTTEQRESIYKVRGTYQPRIADLKQQIMAMQAKELADCESVLTVPQRKILEQFRAARRGGAGRAPEDAGEPVEKPTE